MFKLISETPLPSHCSSGYRGLGWDGCFFYLTHASACAVDRLDARLCLEECIETCRPYSCLCYDPGERCFWAASDARPATLFKLDHGLREIDCRCLRGVRGVITGLSFQCCAGHILVSLASGTALVDRDGQVLHHEKDLHWVKGVLSLCPYTLIWSLAGGETLVRLKDRRGEVLDECRLPCSLCVEAAVFYPCAKDCRCHIYVLVRKHGSYPYLLDCVLENDCVCRSLCLCNRILCGCEKPEKCSCNDVLESIALMEAALSHILNAEGEKLQKVIATTDDPCTLLEVNKAVNATLVNATHLEQVLFHKLEALKEVCGFCDPCDKKEDVR